MLEIGSDLWDTNTFRVSERNELWWENSNYNVYCFKSGRNAIKALLSFFEEGKKSVAIPEYTCETVIQPFIDAGWNIYYYEVNSNLSINTDSLLSICDRYYPEIVYIQQYFGFKTSNVDEVLWEIKKKGIAIVEDITQSLLSDFCVKCADYYVASLRKYIAIPDGGILVSKHHLKKMEIQPPDGEIALTAKKAFDLKKEYFNTGDIEIKQLFRNQFQKLHEKIANNEEIRAISEESWDIFEKVDFVKIREIRRENYRKLHKELADIKWLNSMFVLNENVCPLYLPVMVNLDRKEFRTYLANNNVYCPVIWPKSKYIVSNSKTIEDVYKRILCFPIDQRYGKNEMMSISRIVREFKEN